MLPLFSDYPATSKGNYGFIHVENCNHGLLFLPLFDAVSPSIASPTTDHGFHPEVPTASIAPNFSASSTSSQTLPCFASSAAAQGSVLKRV